MEYRVFKKSVKGRLGRQVHRWYYYYIDQNGKQIQKSCGKGIKNRSDAEDFIRTFPDYGDPAAVAQGRVLIKTIAGDMYIPGSAHYKRRAELGKSTDLNTMREARGIIKKITADFGDLYIDDLDAIMVTKRLLDLDWSGSRKNRYIQVLGEIYQEAIWYGSKVVPPKFPTFRRNVRKADIFTPAELNQIFVPENFPSEMMFLFFLCCLSAGLRLGEARAIRQKQILFDRKVLIVDGYCKQNGDRTNYNKKGSPDNPKFRIVFLPDMTIERLEEFTSERGLQPEDLVFTTAPGIPIRSEWAEDIFDRALIKAGLAIDLKKLDREAKRTIREGNKPLCGISYKETDYRKRNIFIVDGRKLVPHSFRYTYVSLMRRELSANELQPLTGHTSVDMVDYYNRKVLDLALAGLPPSAAAAANTLFTG
jgi:integrase